MNRPSPIMGTRKVAHATPLAQRGHRALSQLAGLALVGTTRSHKRSVGRFPWTGLWDT